MIVKSFVVQGLLQLGWAATVSNAQQASSADLTVCSAPFSQVATNASDSNIWPWQTYKSSSAKPPALLINSTGEPLYEGLLVFATEDGPVPAARQQSPLIMTDGGELVWSGPDEITYNFRVQTLFGAPVLTYWSGEGTAGAESVAGHGYGQVKILDTKYNTIHRVCPRINLTLPPGTSGECIIDVHESYITPRNTMLVSAYNTTKADLTSVGGPKDGWILDSLAVEVNITTGEVMWTWSPLAHVALKGSKFPLAGTGHNTSLPWDFFHINAIQPLGENYLINSRHFWTTYLVNATGDIIWEINGFDGGDFGSLPEGGKFSWQHFGRLEYQNSTAALLHYFANNNGLPGAAPQLTTGLMLQLSLPPDKSSPPKLVTNLTDPLAQIAAYSQGSYTPLPNGNSLMGYGANAVLVEYGPVTGATGTTGRVRWSAQLGYGEQLSVYRAYKQAWHATPATAPELVVLEAQDEDALALCAANSTARGYVSWNGATDVTDWVVYAGSSKTSLKPVAQVKKAAFETQFVVPAGAAFVQVGAMENGGNAVVRTSKVVAVG
ncbi:hypothetical protein CLAIMM_02601 [Cladophialophora immunda]|nr:hypothetical protein CLAIMM_02601 [Cladophialophora immunda]